MKEIDNTDMLIQVSLSREGTNWLGRFNATEVTLPHSESLPAMQWKTK